MKDGEDNGVVALVEDQFDWHNTFVGGYFMGDISFVRYTSVNNDHAVYWKYGKNMADPEEFLSFSFYYCYNAKSSNQIRNWFRQK